MSSFNIPTLKSWSVLSIPFIQPGGSWTLRKFSSLFLSGVGNVKESESLLLMPSGSHSFTSQYHTSQNNSQWKKQFVLVEDAYLQSWKYPETRTRQRGCYRVKLSLQWVSVRNEGRAGAGPGFFLGGGALVSCSTSTPIRELNKESRWSDWPSFHKPHQRAQVNNNLSSAKHLMLDFSRPILMFRSNKTLG